jgi:hypothetical protein
MLLLSGGSDNLFIQLAEKSGGTHQQVIEIQGVIPTDCGARHAAWDNPAEFVSENDWVRD